MRAQIVVVITLLLIAACKDERVPALQKRVVDLEVDLRKAREELRKQTQGNQELSTKLAALEKATANTSEVPSLEPTADLAELAAANNTSSASEIVAALCREKSLGDKVAEAKCWGEQEEGLRTLIRGRPLGVGISAAAFGIVRVRCAKAFPRDYSMRAFCEQQELQKLPNSPLSFKR